MSAKHTPGPWSERNGRIFQADQPNLTIANIARAFDGDYSPTNARRIVACVNACEGISTERLEDLGRPMMQHLIGCDERAARQVKEAADLTARRDELLDALKAARQSLEVANDEPGGPIRDTIWHGPAETLFDFIDAAIAKATNPD